MAEVAELLPLPTDSDDDDDDEEFDDDYDVAAPPRRARPSAPPSAPGRQIHRYRGRRRLDYRHLDPGIFVPVFSPPTPTSSSSSFFRVGRGVPPGYVSGSDSDSDSDDLCDRAAIDLDLFGPSTPRRRGGMVLDPFRDGVGPLRFGAVDGVEEVASGYREVGRGLGLGFGVENLRGEEGGFCGVDLEVEGLEWRVALDSLGGNGEDGERRSGIFGFRSDSDSDAEGEGGVVGRLHSGDLVVPRGMADLGVPLCWDCLRIEEGSRDLDEDFDWEEVDGALDEREVRSMVHEEVDANLEIGGEDEEEEAVRNIEWEVLLDVNDLERNAAIEHQGTTESYLGEEHEGFVYTSEYEILVGQFADHESSIKGNPPAAKSVVERLPSIVLTQGDADSNTALCAVCKDEILVEEKAKQLPCSHHYHIDCILPWLRIRNTCPVCRYELPTDDPDYENWRTQRAGGRGVVQEFHVRHNFEIFHEE